MICNENNFWNFQLGQISHTIFWGAEGLGEGCTRKKRLLFPASMAHLLIFIHNGGIWKGTIQPRLKNDTHFSHFEKSCKRVQCSNE